jgi:hypothetical protein
MFQKKIIVSFICLLTILALSSSRRDPNNPPIGHTGAPGEQTCAKSGCHNGGSFAGTVTISGVPDTVLANNTYPITLTNTSNAIRAGFQLTCFDNSNAGCGTITAATGVSIGNGGGKQYARQSTPKTLSGGTTSWTFNWKAPAMLTNENIRFYFSSLCANGNGNSSSDNVLTGSRLVIWRATSAAGEPETPLAYTYSVNHSEKQLQIALTQASKGAIEIFGMNGQTMLKTTIGASENLSLQNCVPGIYIVHLSSGDKSESFKFYLN